MINRLFLNTDHGTNSINRHIYGHFAEHLGRCIYDGIWVGEQSSIPNTRGIRTDIVKALRNLNLPNLRWPGGCFADEYHWKDGIGPREERPCMVNTHWGGVVENNHFGTHEYMDLCEQLGCEPYICGNVGSSSVREMQQWVEYLTSDKGPLAERRSTHGRKQPWKVRFWGVGNENWGCGGRMRPEYYADLFRRYSTYCRNFASNTLYKIACGPNGRNYNWTEVLMREGSRFMDGLSLHYYTRIAPKPHRGSATQFDEKEWFTLLKNALQMDEIISRHATIMDSYDPEKRVGLIVDEWGTWYEVEPGTNPRFLYQQNTLRDAIVAGLTLNIFNNHSERVQMANIAQTINVLQSMVLTRGGNMVLTPSYHVFEMYKVHHDATLLPLELQCDTYEFKNESIPTLSASASRNRKGVIHLSLCNLDPDRNTEISCTLRGTRTSGVKGRLLTSNTMNAHNTFEHPDAVHPVPFRDATIKNDSLTISLPSKSVAVLELS